MRFVVRKFEPTKKLEVSWAIRFPYFGRVNASSSEACHCGDGFVLSPVQLAQVNEQAHFQNNESESKSGEPNEPDRTCLAHLKVADDQTDEQKLQRRKVFKDFRVLLTVMCLHENFLVMSASETAERPTDLIALLVYLMRIGLNPSVCSYDLACRTAATLKRLRPDLAKSFNWILPHLHSLAHGSACQIDFGSFRSFPNVPPQSRGSWEGEGIERGNSALNVWFHVFKNLSQNHFIALLELIQTGVNLRKIMSSHHLLYKKFTFMGRKDKEADEAIAKLTLCKSSLETLRQSVELGTDISLIKNVLATSSVECIRLMVDLKPLLKSFVALDLKVQKCIAPSALSASVIKPVLDDTRRLFDANCQKITDILSQCAFFWSLVLDR